MPQDGAIVVVILAPEGTIATSGVEKVSHKVVLGCGMRLRILALVGTARDFAYSGPWNQDPTIAVWETDLSGVDRPQRGSVGVGASDAAAIAALCYPTFANHIGTPGS